MPTPKKAAQPTKSQRERFMETARDVEADESGKTFERTFKKLIPPKKAKPSNRRSRSKPLK